MKTRMLGSWGLALAVMGLPFVAGSLRADDTSDASGQVASATPDVVPNDAPAPLTPPDVNLSRGAAEVAKLAQSGLGDPLMQAYIKNARSKFNLGSDQIVYLSDIGVSSDVVKSMIERDAALDAATQAALANNSTPPAPTAPPDTAQPAPPMVDDSNPANPPPDLGNDGSINDADYFYNSLSPYGSWVYVNGCGLCWQPTVCLSDHHWQPYCDRGRWLDSDCGWYWQSDYSWGWAPFHYGRWFNATDRGWVWMPDRVWGPAWVSWRHSSDYCGWAPLPPSARFVPGTGLVAGNHAVRGNFEFGLSAALYTFIPLARMSDYAPSRYSVPAWQAGEVFGRTTVANHFATENNHAVNHSIDPREVSSQAGIEIRHIEVRDANNNNGTPSDRVAKHGGSMVVFRSQLPAPTPSRMTVPSGSQRNTAPNRTYVPQRSSSLPQHFAQSVYLSGSQSSHEPETYPTGSLVVIGSRNNTVANRIASSSGSGYRVFDSAVPGPTHEVQAATEGRESYVIPARSDRDFADRSHISHGTDRFAHDNRTDSRSAIQGEARSQSHSEFRSEARSESRPAAEHNSSSSGAASHAASSSSGNSSSSSSTGHK